jgi:hypothetical protein
LGWEFHTPAKPIPVAQVLGYLQRDPSHWFCLNHHAITSTGPLKTLEIKCSHICFQGFELTFLTSTPSTQQLQVIGTTTMAQ